MISYPKKIYDAVHGFIRFNGIERDLIDSPAFQRLHHIRQLGIAFLIYPGATHTRFEHSLGTMEVATRIFEHLLSESFSIYLQDIPYWKQIVRLAALCHDLGHLPFSHDAESAILGGHGQGHGQGQGQGHEEWTVKVIRSPLLQPIWDQVTELFPGHTVAEDVVYVAVGPDKLQEMGWKIGLESWKKILSAIITADFFGADRIDYLLRDAKCTGVSYGLFDYHQLIEMLRILPRGEALHLGIDGNGIESCESLLLARHFMHQRVYNYSSVQAHKYHLRQFMQAFYAQGDYLDSLESYLTLSDNEILTAIRIAAKDPQAVGHAHAACLLEREKRFRPVAIDHSLSVEMLQEMREHLKIPKECLSWNLSKKAGERGLSFPVLMPSGAVIDAAELSQIRIPSAQKNWAFVSAAYEQSFRCEMERCKDV